MRTYSDEELAQERDARALYYDDQKARGRKDAPSWGDLAPADREHYYARLKETQQ